MRLDGRGVIVTGGSHGLGASIAAACLADGAHVIVCAREVQALHERVARLNATAHGRAHAVVADVSSVADVQRLVDEARRVLPGLHGLVNNAGVYGPIGRIEDTDPAEWEQAVRINLVGTAQMCRAVVPVLREQKAGSIVNVSGGGATRPLPGFSAYAASKAAVVRLTETLAQELRDDGVRVNAIAPGALNTRLLDEVLAAGAAVAGGDSYDRALAQKRDGGAPLETAAALSVYLLSDLSESVTGKLVSARWDDWRSLHERLRDLDGTDLYTLRRVTEPQQRGAEQ